MIEDHLKPLYLAGPISGLTYKQANDQRGTAEAKTDFACAGWVGLNPLEGYEALDNGQPLKTWFEEDVEGGSTEAGVAADLRMIDASDAVFANFFRGYGPSIGTAAEIGYAYASSKPIVSLLPKGSDNNHPFIVSLSWAVTDCWADALAALADLRHQLEPVPYA